MAREPRLTELAQQRIGTIVRSGDIAVDATAGNGHDTLFLAERVGPAGQVYAFDIQAQALERTRRRLEAVSLAGRVKLIQLGHEHLCAALPKGIRGSVTAVMFNLGYLPGGDTECVTRIDTTLAALDQAVACLRAGGILTVVAYPGHPGGGTETAAVREWLRRHPVLAPRLKESRPSTRTAPVLFTSRV